MSFVGFLQRFNGRVRPAPPPDFEPGGLYPFSPPPAVENRTFAPPEDMRTIPTTGPFPVGTPVFAPPEASAFPMPVNAFGQPIPGASPSVQRDVNPDSTTGKPIPLYTPGGPRPRITPVDVRHEGEQR